MELAFIFMCVLVLKSWRPIMDCSYAGTFPSVVSEMPSLLHSLKCKAHLPLRLPHHLFSLSCAFCRWVTGGFRGMWSSAGWRQWSSYYLALDYLFFVWFEIAACDEHRRIRPKQHWAPLNPSVYPQAWPTGPEWAGLSLCHYCLCVARGIHHELGLNLCVRRHLFLL